MEQTDMFKLPTNARVYIHDRSRPDHAFEGRVGEFLGIVSFTGIGFAARLHLEGEPKTMKVIVNAESIEVIRCPECGDPTHAAEDCDMEG